MFRKANAGDREAVVRIFDAIHTQEEQGLATVGWQRGVYPTAETFDAAVQVGDLYVLEEDGQVLAAARINHEQVPVYANAAWRYPARDDEVLVLHTLVVAPWAAGKGCGRRFVAFYEQRARELGCPHLRMDTNLKNAKARRLYQRLGYWEADVVPCAFNGIEGVELVCLEKKL